jgi:hypothetical protein
MSGWMMRCIWRRGEGEDLVVGGQIGVRVTFSYGKLEVGVSLL